MNRLVGNRFHVQIPDQQWFEENIGCENACPVNTRAPQYISAIRKGDYNLAFELNRGDNLFPAILGRICVHPCEEKCRRGLLIDLPISICSLKRACADHRVLFPRRKGHQKKGIKRLRSSVPVLPDSLQPMIWPTGLLCHNLRNISDSRRDAQCGNPSLPTSQGSCQSGD